MALLENSLEIENLGKEKFLLNIIVEEQKKIKEFEEKTKKGISLDSIKSEKEELDYETYYGISPKLQTINLSTFETDKIKSRQQLVAIDALLSADVIMSSSLNRQHPDNGKMTLHEYSV